MIDENAQGSETLHDSLARSGNGGGLRFFRFVSATSGQHPTVRFEQQKDAIAEELTHGWSYAIGAALISTVTCCRKFTLPTTLVPTACCTTAPPRATFSSAPLVGESRIDGHARLVRDQPGLFQGHGLGFPGDINGDGLLDIYVSNLTSPWALTESHFLWLNTGQTERMKDGVIAPFRHKAKAKSWACHAVAGRGTAGWRISWALTASWKCRSRQMASSRGKSISGPNLQSLGTSNNQLLNNPKFWPNLQPGDDVKAATTRSPFLREGQRRPLLRRGPQVEAARRSVDVRGDGDAARHRACRRGRRWPA